MILAIDPGPVESAYVLIMDQEKLKPVEFGIEPNEAVMEYIKTLVRVNENVNHFVIEMVACYGMPVGKEVFETVFWIGRFWQASTIKNKYLIYRKDVKMNICQDPRAKDGNVIQALIDRFAFGARNKGKGTKSEPGWFYGFKADIWQAYACGVTLHDLYL